MTMSKEFNTIQDLYPFQKMFIVEATSILGNFETYLLRIRQFNKLKEIMATDPKMYIPQGIQTFLVEVEGYTETDIEKQGESIKQIEIDKLRKELGILKENV